MMKRTLLCVTALVLAAAAKADVTLHLGNALLSANQSTSITANLSGTCTGISISVDFQPDAIARAHESWCSDGALIVTPPAGLGGSQWGGSDVVFGTGTLHEGYWIFDGPRSALPGVYTDSRPATNIKLAGQGVWIIGWGNGWSDSTPVQYNTITVTLRGVSEVPVCRVDFDGDGFVTGSDFDNFVQAFEVGDLATDFDDDGFVTGVDFDQFVQAFEAGC